MHNSALRAPLSQFMKDDEPELRLQRVWQGIRGRREAAKRAGFWRHNACALATAATVSALVIMVAFMVQFGRSSGPRGPVALALPANIEPGTAAREVDFGDGAVASVQAGARLDILEQSERAVVLALRRGFSQFDIRPGGARRFRIESGGVTVDVVGTRFSVDRRETSVQVAVQRGRVLVRGAGVIDQVQALDAGKSIVVELAPATAQPDRPAPEAAPAPTAVASEAVRTNSASSLVAPAAMLAPAASGDWQKAASRQDWNQAWKALGSDGVAQAAAHTDDVADLLALADIARLSGHPQHALTPLRQIVGNHADDPRSAMAAFTLGRILLDNLGQPMQASFAFERALTLRLPASLAEDALARLVEAHAKAGAIGQAQAAAKAYRASYPSGRRLAEVNRWSKGE